MKNKYYYYYVLQGYYGFGWEDLTQSENYKEIMQDLKDYLNNEHGAYRIIKRRVLK